MRWGAYAAWGGRVYVVAAADARLGGGRGLGEGGRDENGGRDDFLGDMWGW